MGQSGLSPEVPRHQKKVSSEGILDTKVVKARLRCGLSVTPLYQAAEGTGS